MRGEPLIIQTLGSFCIFNFCYVIAANRYYKRLQKVSRSLSKHWAGFATEFLWQRFLEKELSGHLTSLSLHCRHFKSVSGYLPMYYILCIISSLSNILTTLNHSEKIEVSLSTAGILNPSLVIFEQN